MAKRDRSNANAHTLGEARRDAINQPDAPDTEKEQDQTKAEEQKKAETPEPSVKKQKTGNDTTNLFDAQEDDANPMAKMLSLVDAIRGATAGVTQKLVDAMRNPKPKPGATMGEDEEQDNTASPVAPNDDPTAEDNPDPTDDASSTPRPQDPTSTTLRR